MNSDPVFLRQLPALETDRLVLRQTTVSDAERYMAMNVRICADETAARFVVGDRFASLEHATAKLVEVERRFREENSAIPWTITLKGSDDLVGITGFVRWNKKSFCSEVMYELDPLHWQKGIVTEALARVRSFGFEEMKLHRVEAHIDPENVRSVRVVERLGFAREGLLRENTFYEGRFFDTAIYAALA
jgi:[ribosomal protein S5]-alanine N-acetyltransferase